MHHTAKQPGIPPRLQKLLVPLVYLLGWAILARAIDKSYLIPAPLETLRRFFEILMDGESWLKAGLTLGRILTGYALGVVMGILLAALSAKSRLADALLSPLRGVIKATPVTSIILLAILFLTSGAVPIFISFLMVLPLIWMNVLSAIQATDKNLLEFSRAYGFTRFQRLKLIYAPSVQPALLSAATTSLGFAWKSGVAAEILSLPKQSVGYMLYESKLTLETLDLFAWTLLIILLSMGIESLVKLLLRRLRRD